MSNVYREFVSDFDVRYFDFLKSTRFLSFLEKEYDFSVEYFFRKGKRLRPYVLKRSFDAFGGSGDIFEVLCAVELFHTALLIQDDIFDHDVIRRGETSFHHLFIEHGFDQTVAERKSILISHLIFSDAYLTLVSASVCQKKLSSILSIVNQYSLMTAFGEYDDLMLDAKADETAIDVVMRNKTAGYSFVAPLLIAALLSDADTAAFTDFLAEIGFLVGETFQIMDDFLVLFEQNNKDVFSDFREYKATYLTHYLLERGCDLDAIRSEKDLFLAVDKTELVVYLRALIASRKEKIDALLLQLDYDKKDVFESFLKELFRLIHI